MKLLTKFVIYCVVYCLTINITHQSNSDDIFGSGDRNILVRTKRAALRDLNASQSPAVSDDTTHRKRRTKTTPLDFIKHKEELKSIVDFLLPNHTTPSWEQLRPSMSSLQDFPPDSQQIEISKKQFKKLYVRMFFDKYRFHPKYDQFYDWFYDVLRQPHRMERRWRAFQNFTGTFDYDNLLSSTPISIPTAYHHFYAAINEIERIYKIRPEDPPSIDEELFDSGYTPSPSPNTNYRKELRKYERMFKTARTQSWEDSEELNQAYWNHFIPEGCPEKYKPFHRWLASIYMRMCRDKKKNNAYVNLEHINVFKTQDYQTEFNNTPFPIPDEHRELWPIFKNFDLAYEGVTQRYNDTHYTVITTESTPKITKSTPKPPWKKCWRANPRNSTYVTIPPHLTHLINASTWKLFSARKSGRNYTLITMPWDDKVNAFLRVFLTNKMKWMPKTTAMQFDPQYKKYLDWEKDALYDIGDNVAKIDFSADKMTSYSTRDPDKLPFPVPVKRREFFERISHYLEQIKKHTTYRWHITAGQR
ncbi:uncharacterized protein LOC135834739 [Planococcus citri]|uniref:uncharacterized protein LOC135834739 n=1 Tax=Planococcus citri TaxID=170843 RepID=UPI0031F841F7